MNRVPRDVLNATGGVEHLKPDRFEYNLLRRNLVALHGRSVMNFTMAQARDERELVRSIRQGPDLYRRTVRSCRSASRLHGAWRGLRTFASFEDLGTDL